jgi:hypothetical protein
MMGFGFMSSAIQLAQVVQAEFDGVRRQMMDEAEDQGAIEMAMMIAALAQVFAQQAGSAVRKTTRTTTATRFRGRVALWGYSRAP